MLIIYNIIITILISNLWENSDFDFKLFCNSRFWFQTFP